MFALITFTQYLAMVWSKRELIIYLVKSNLKLSTARTFLGYLWWAIDPLLYMSVYYLLVEVIFERGGENFAAYLFIALIPWKWTISSIVDATGSINSNASIIKQLPVPKVIFPITNVFVNSFRFLVGVCVLIIFLIVYGIPITPYALLYPVIMIVQLTFLMAFALIFALLGTFIRDTKNMIQYLLRLWFYLSPGIYMIDRIPDSLQFYLWLNPITHFFMGYRDLLLYHQFPNFWGLGLIFVISLVVIVFGLNKFKKLESEFAKVV